MASFTTALQDYYEKEKLTGSAISGAGWYFALTDLWETEYIINLRQAGLILRDKLGDVKIPVKATPTDTQGYGLHAIATKEK